MRNFQSLPSFKLALRKTMNLLKVDQTTGKADVVGNIGHDVVGLAYNPQNKTLYATAHEKHQLVEIDLNTGKGKTAVTLSDRDRQVGEIAFDKNGTAYITLIGTDLKKHLATCDLKTGAVNLLGEIYFPGLASMKFIGDTLYGVGGQYEGLGGTNGQVIRIDTTTGCGSLVLNTKPALCWAGLAVVERASVPAPAPVPAPVPIPSPIPSPPVTNPDYAAPTPVPDVIGVGGGGGSIVQDEINFVFKFDDSQLEQAWAKIAAKVEESVTIIDEQDATVEARRWDQLENWLLTGYKAQAKDLALQVARLELMMSTFKQQLESNLQLTFRRWSSHFDGRLQGVVGTQITEVTQSNLAVAMERLKIDILNQTSQMIQTEINSAKTEINQSIESQISTVQSAFRQSLETQLSSMRTAITETISTQLTTAKAEIDQKISTKITTAKTEIDQSISTQVTNAKTEINESVNVTNVVSSEVSESIKNTVLRDIDTQFSDVRTNISTLEKNVDIKLETMRVDFRGEVVSTILAQINQLIEEKTKLEIAKVDFNTYLAQIDARANKYLEQLNQLEVTLITRINQGDTHLYNWVLEQLMTLKGCLADRQVLVDQLALFSNELKTRLDTAPCVNPTVFEAWTPLPLETKTLPGGADVRQLPSS